MVNTRSMTRKLRKISDNDDPTSWSNLPHDLMFLIMLHLGVFDFIALSGVCKSWRSVANSYWNKFMVSKQPMYLSISDRMNKKECYLEDYTRRKSKTIIPHSNGRMCIGLTCGYLIFFGKKTRDFWLVNPFTRKELHFPRFPFDISIFPTYARGILVFSPSMSGWVLVVIPHRFSNEICFSLAGKQARWRHIFCDSPIRDLHFFKGKIYTINTGRCLYELRLSPLPTLTLFNMKNFPWSSFRYIVFVSSDEYLYAMNCLGREFEVYEADLNEMKWVSSERTIGECALFVSEFKCDAAIKLDTWVHPWTQYERVNYSHRSHPSKIRGRCLTTSLWYFPHECLIDNDSGALLNKLED